MGDATDPAPAFTAVSKIASGAAAGNTAEGAGNDAAGVEQTEQAANPAQGQPEEQANPLAGPIMWIVGGVVALALIISFTLLTLSNRKNNRAALARGLESTGGSVGSAGSGSSGGGSTSGGAAGVSGNGGSRS